MPYFEALRKLRAIVELLNYIQTRRLIELEVFTFLQKLSKSKPAACYDDVQVMVTVSDIAPYYLLL